jgi:hypothetical protein
VSILALSISGGVKTLGAYAGLAAIAALALLALLYFAQARELKHLREWMERESARRSAPPMPAPGAGAQPPRAPAVAEPSAVPVGPGVPVVTTVEGARRVPIPAAAAGVPVVAAASVVPAPPDAATVSGDLVAGAEPATGETPLEEQATDAAVPRLPPAPEPAAPALPRLVADAVPGQAPGTEHEIGSGLLIGRGKVASLRVSDPLASARHARISREGDQFMLEDLGSTNGTFVNGVQMSAPTQLGEGDRVRLGESEFVFRLATAAREPNGASLPPRPAALPLLAAPAPERAVELPPTPIATPAPERPFELPPDDELASLVPRAHRSLRHPFSHDDGEDFELRLPPPPDPARPPGRGRWLAVGAIVLALAAVAIAIVELAPGSSPKKPAQHSSTQTPPAGATTTPPARKKHGATSAPAPSSVTVAVFNAAGRQGLASTVSAKLSTDGYGKGAVANAAAQSATTVGYGAGERAAALEVARALGLPASDVAPMTSAIAAAAGGAQVAVTLGADYAG